MATYPQMNESDMQLLQRYAKERAEDAFTELVRRHLGLVYSAVLRQVQSPELAQEVSQTVFLDLSRNAKKLPPTTILSAWLYQVARRSAIDVVRRETRRHLREKTAQQLTDMNSTSADWRDIEPLLDEAMQSLDETDRAAVVLRYFENKSMREVGESLGSSENAAQKRLSRAVDQLSEFFTNKGLRTGAGAITAAIASNAVHAVPAGLITTISATVTSTGTAALAATTLTTMTAKNAILAVALVAAVGASIYQSQRAAKFETQLATAISRPPATDDDHLRNQLDDALKQVAALRSEAERTRTHPELLRLRNEVSSLKREARAATEPEPMADAAKNWLTRLNALKTRLQEHPEAQVPEMQLLKEEDWLAAVKSPNLESDEDFRKAFATLRNTAQGKFAAIIHPALLKYMKENNAQFPTDLAQLLPHCDPPLDPSMLTRYSIQPAADVPNVKVGGKWAITQNAPVDPEFDSRNVIGPDGHGSASYPKPTALTPKEFDSLRPAFKAYEAANNGREATLPEEIEPFLQTPEQKTIYKKFMKMRNQSNTANSNLNR